MSQVRVTLRALQDLDELQRRLTLPRDTLARVLRAVERADEEQGPARTHHDHVRRAARPAHVHVP